MQQTRFQQKKALFCFLNRHPFSSFKKVQPGKQGRRKSREGGYSGVLKECATQGGGGRMYTKRSRPTLLVPTPLQGDVEDCKISAGHLLRINPNRPSGFHERRFTNSSFKAHRAALRCPGDSVTSRLSSG